MKKLFFCFLIFCFGITAYPLPCFAQTSVRLYFYQAGTDFPVNDVTVIIPETQTKLQMHSGDALPVFEKSSVTLLFYKEGYADTAVFGFPLSGKTHAKYALYQKSDFLPFVAYAETPCEKDILALLNAYREWLT